MDEWQVTHDDVALCQGIKVQGLGSRFQGPGSRITTRITVLILTVFSLIIYFCEEAILVSLR